MYLIFNKCLLKIEHVRGLTSGEIILLTPFSCEMRMSNDFRIRNFFFLFCMNLTNALSILVIQREIVRLIWRWLLGFCFKLKSLNFLSRPLHLGWTDGGVSLAQELRKLPCRVPTVKLAVSLWGPLPWPLSDAIPGRSQRQWYTNAILVTVKL